MSEVALGRRRKRQILARRLRHAAVEGLRRARGGQLPTEVSSIGVVGTQGDARLLADALARVQWAAPPGARVIVDGEPSAPPPAWAPPDVPSRSGGLTVDNPTSADVMLIARAGTWHWLRRGLQDRALITDPLYYSGVEVESHATLSSLGTSPTEWYQIDERSKEALGSLVSRFAGLERAAVFGTGPSMTSIDPGALKAGLTIACNSAVSNQDWLSSAHPGVIAFADPVFHFGPSGYAHRFRQDLSKAAASTDATFLIPRRFAPLVLRHLPELSDRLIAVDHDRRAALGTLHPDRLVVPQTSNVLTLLMLPLATALAREVVIAGCDGRRPSERYFWEHNRELQYDEDLMASAFDAHPSFFRDRDYRRYYEEHCVQLESMLDQAEHAGFRFANATRSEIPALCARSL